MLLLLRVVAAERIDWFDVAEKAADVNILRSKSGEGSRGRENISYVATYNTRVPSFFLYDL